MMTHELRQPCTHGADHRRQSRYRLETANQPAKLGFHVIVAARDEASGNRAVEGINASGGKASFLHLDVSSSGSIRAAATKFATISDHLDVLIKSKESVLAEIKRLGLKRQD